MTVAERQALVLAHADLAAWLAHRRARQLPVVVDLEDLRSAAYLGLCEAAAKYDAGRGASFRTYARHRIIGALEDHLRGLDPLTRHGRQAVRDGTHQAPHHVPDQDVALESLPDPAPALDTGLLEEARAVLVRGALVRLPARERYILHAYYWRGARNADIARELRLSEGRVSQLRLAGLQRLRQWLTS